MTYGVGTPRDFMPYDRARPSWKIVYQSVLTAATLSLGVLVGALFLYGRPGSHPGHDRTPAVAAAKTTLHSGFAAIMTPLRLAHRTDANATAPAPTTAATQSQREHRASGFAALIAPLREESHLIAANMYGGLLDPNLSSSPAPVSFAESHPLGANFALLPPTDAAAPQEQVAEAEIPVPELRPEAQASEAVPVPMPRPAELAAHEPARAGIRQFAKEEKTVAEATPPEAQQQRPDNSSFFDKLFGAVKQPASGPQLAYASPEDGGIGGILGGNRRVASAPVGGYDHYTAVYNIAAHTVTLPDGTRLEAHSGLGQMMDDPRYIREKMRGATPTGVYDLQPREQLFHGVQALRLLPVNGIEPFGRTGLLAHTYMLGPNGQSNGCVSFRNYAAFLRAYQSGEIRRIAVVAGL
jgi:hypothetical protein